MVLANDEGVLMLKICDFCGKEFETNNKRRLTCSKPCNARRWNRDNPEKVKANARYYSNLYSKKNLKRDSLVDFAMDGLDCLGVYLKMKRMAF